MSEIYLIDLFCGCGGFSQGAVQAGCKPVLAIDSWKEALDVHELNHPDCVHWHHTLGGDVEEFVCSVQTFIDLNLPENCHVHIHASPPCQTLSNASKTRDESGFSMINWTLEVITHIDPHTWSMENVTHPLLKRYVGAKVFNMAEFGIPQTRQRIIISNIDLDCIKTEPKKYACDVLVMVGRDIDWNEYEMISTGSYLRHFRNMNELSYTIMTREPRVRHKISKAMFRLSIQETAALQTFPLTYNFSAKTSSYTMIGNAVPPRFAEKLVQCIKTTD